MKRSQSTFWEKFWAHLQGLEIPTYLGNIDYLSLSSRIGALWQNFMLLGTGISSASRAVPRTFLTPASSDVLESELSSLELSLFQVQWHIVHVRINYCYLLYVQYVPEMLHL